MSPPPAPPSRERLRGARGSRKGCWSASGLPWAGAGEESMPAAQPQLRRDLLLSYQETPEGRFLVVKDPATRRFFRFGEAEHFIVQQLDGSTALDVIQQRVETTFGVVAPLDTLAQFTERLRRIGLLQE